MKKLLCWIVVFGLIFTSGAFTFAENYDAVDGWDDLVAALADPANAGETITLEGNLTATGTAVVSVNNITIDGNGFTITRAPSMTSGSIFNCPITANARFTIVNAVIDGANIAVSGNGAAVAMNTAGTNLLTIKNCVFVNHVASGNGSAIHCGTGTSNGGVTAENCTFANNRATGSTSDGGAIATGLATLTNCTFFGNSADRGGALAINRTGGRIVNCTIVGNVGGSAGGSAIYGNNTTLVNTITIGNTRGNNQEVRSWTDGGFNLIGTYTSLSGSLQGSTTTGITYPVNWLDTSLKDNGGDTPTVALLDVSNSPAIGKGTTAGAPAADQRGVPRKTPPDIGAYEFIPPESEGAEILSVTINGLVAPAALEPAIGVDALWLTDNTECEIIGFSWSPVPETGIFGKGIVYSAAVTLTAKAGYTFTGIAAIGNDLSASATYASSVNIDESGKEANSLVYTVVFPSTQADFYDPAGWDPYTLKILEAKVTATSPATLYRYRQSKASSAEEYNTVGVGFGGDMYQKPGDTANYYTYMRNASLAEPRQFTFRATFNYTGAFDPGRIAWWHGSGGTNNTTSNKPMTGTGAWTRANYMGSGSQALFTQVGTSDYDLSEPGKCTVTATFEVNGGLSFSKSQFTDTRFLTWNLMRNATTRVYYNGAEVASRPFRIPQRDFLYSWLEFSEWIEKIKPTVTAWYNLEGVRTAGSGTYGAVGRYVALELIGKSSGFTNSSSGAPQSRFVKDIWSGVVADSEASVDYYLNTVAPVMNSGNANQVAALSNDPNARMVVYYSNIHADECHGSDSVMYLFQEFAKGNAIYSTTTSSVRKVAGGGSNADYTARNTGTVDTDFSIDMDDLLSKYIFVFTFMENPDGREYGGRYANYRFDPNRDGGIQALPESVASKRNIARWDPLSFIEFHSSRSRLQIDPCAAPHDPNYEADLYYNGSRASGGMMNRQAHAMGAAVLGTQVNDSYVIPEEDIRTANERFDDIAPVYSPQYAMLLGSLAVTVESVSEAARDVWANAILSYGALEDQFNNWEDYWDFKLEYKKRGVTNENTDSKVNPYLYSGNKLITPLLVRQIPFGGTKFFPDYYVIPMDDSQLDCAQALDAVRYLTRSRVAIELLTAPSVIGGKTYPAGTYVVDMRQGNRYMANMALSKGTDASIVSQLYSAMNVVNLPAMRGFTSVRVEGLSVLNAIPANYTMAGGLKTITDDRALSRLSSNIGGAARDYVIIKNSSLDAIRLVLAALGASGQTPRPVKMITGNPPEDFVCGDFVMSYTDYLAVNTGGNRFYVEGMRVGEEPSVTRSLVRPKISLLNQYGDNVPLAFEKLGLRIYGAGSVNDTSTATDVRMNISASGTSPIAGQNVIINYNRAINATDGNTITTALNNRTAGFIQVGATGMATGGAYLGEGFARSSAPSGTGELVMTGTYATNNLVTTRTENAEYVYSGNREYLSTLPAGAAVLMTTNNTGSSTTAYDPLSSFVAGKASAAQKVAMKGKVLAAVGTYQDVKGNAPVIVFADDIFNRAHYEASWRMLGNAILLAAAQIDPSVTEVAFSDLSADGEANIATTAELTITLGKVVPGLSAADITVTGAKLDALDSTDAPYYKLAISDFNAVQGEIVNVSIAKQGHVFTPSGRDVEVNAETWYNVEYDANGGTGHVADVSVKHGEDHTIAANGFSNPGLGFTGWNTQADGEGTAYAAGETVYAVTADMLLYAQWAHNSGTVVDSDYIIVCGVELGYRVVNGIAKLEPTAEQMKALLSCDCMSIVIDLGEYAGLDFYSSATLYKDVDKTITFITEKGSDSLKTKSLWNNSGKVRLVSVRNGVASFSNI